MTRVRVAQVGVGPVGRRMVLEASAAGLEIVGAVDPAPEIAGHALDDLLDRRGPHVEVDASPEALAARVDPDVVLHATGSFLAEVADQLRFWLERGVSVVSTCEELAYPFHRHPELSAELDTLAEDRGAVLLGVGVNPGFVMDKLVATLLAACRRVDRVSASRVVDAATRREPLQRKVGAGLTPAVFAAQRASGRIGHVGLVESALMLADVIGVPTDSRRVSELLSPVMAERHVRTAALDVEPGEVAGVHQVVGVEQAGRERVNLEMRMFVGAREPGDRVKIEGSPNLEMTVPGGVPGDEATATLAVRAAVLVGGLAPGLRTMLDVPMRYVP